MISIELDSSSASARSEAVLGDFVLAAIAAHAANGVFGVCRTEPSITELVSSVVRLARRPLLGLEPASTRGVRVTVESCSAAPPVVRVDVNVSVRGQALAVGEAVRDAVVGALVEDAGVSGAVVTVSIVDIEVGEVLA